MKVKKGKKYEICTTHIQGISMSCFIIQAKEKKDIKIINGYLKSERATVKEL